MLAALRACSDAGPLYVTPPEPRLLAPRPAPAVVGRFVLGLAALGKAARLISADGVKRRVAGAVALILGLAQLMAVTVR